MEVIICIPLEPAFDAALFHLIEAEYPDIYEDKGHDDHRRFFAGKSSDEHVEDEEEYAELMEGQPPVAKDNPEYGYPWSQQFLSYDEAVECCGFVEGAYPSAETLLEGNGAWAQCMMSCRDFSSVSSAGEEQVARWKARSDRWWAAFARGEKAREALLKTTANKAQPSQPTAQLPLP